MGINMGLLNDAWNEYRSEIKVLLTGAMAADEVDADDVLSILRVAFFMGAAVADSVHTDSDRKNREAIAAELDEFGRLLGYTNQG